MVTTTIKVDQPNMIKDVLEQLAQITSIQILNLHPYLQPFRVFKMAFWLSWEAVMLHFRIPPLPIVSATQILFQQFLEIQGVRLVKRREILHSQILLLVKLISQPLQ